MESLDLDIDNYDLLDILKLFKIQYHFTEEDLKNVKRTVLKTHPDKSKLDKKYFLFFTKAYKILYQVFNFRHRIKTSNESFEKDYEADDIDLDEENEKIIETIKKSKNFNKLFNEIFDNMTLKENTTGYGDWLKEDNSFSISCKNVGEMKDVLNKHKSQMPNALVKHEINDYQSNYGQSLLDQDNITSYSSSMFDKLRYDDLKEAHENSIIPVVDDERNIKHKTVHELEKERSIKTATLSSEESNKILHSKYERTEQQGSTLAFKLAKETEQYELQNRKLMSKFRQLMNN